MDEESTIGFLTELTALTQKYGITLGGCGCCGSPYLRFCDEIDGKIYSIDDGFVALMFTEDNDDRICGREVKACHA